MKVVTIRLIRTYNFTARLIHIGMWLWAFLRGIPRHRCYNHAEVGFGEWTSGAISEGVKTRRFEDYLKNETKRAEYVEYPLELSLEEYNRVMRYVRSAEGVKYEFENFFWHLVKIIIGKWIGSKTTRKTYCYEHVIRALNSSLKYDIDPFLNPYEFKKLADAILL